MATNFLDLCNQVLRRLNEVEITPGEFSSVNGVQAAVKDAINAAIADLNHTQYEWPFNAAQETGALAVGAVEYTYPALAKTLDWGSFTILNDGLLNTQTRTLKYISRDEWYKRLQSEDLDNATNGIRIPEFVFPSHGTGFGVSPAPDKTYRISFRYFRYPDELVNATDVPRMPNQFTTVIVDGAMYHMYMFKDNAESAQLSAQMFQRGVDNMRGLFINKTDNLRDTRVNFGGGNSYSRISSVNNA